MAIFTGISILLILVVTVVLAVKYRNKPDAFEQKDPRVSYFPQMVSQIQRYMMVTPGRSITRTTLDLQQDIGDFYYCNGNKECFVIPAISLADGDVIKWGGSWREVRDLEYVPRPEEEGPDWWMIRFHLDGITTPCGVHRRGHLFEIKVG